MTQTKTLHCTTPRFATGQIVITTNAVRRLTPDEINQGFARHISGDWGNVCSDDAKANDDALENGDRLLSAYGEGTRRFWIITEYDRSVTTILMPEDY